LEEVISNGERKWLLGELLPKRIMANMIGDALLAFTSCLLEIWL
jgi:hypothetical protein